MALFDEDQKNHLFETHQRTARSFGSYLKLILLVGLGVSAAAGLVIYLTLPGVGDQVKTPAGLEDAVRSHFLDVEKRTATDVVSYLCDSYYWIRADVETRPDIPGKPHNTVPRFRAKASQSPDGSWKVTASPILTPEDDVPCRY